MSKELAYIKMFNRILPHGNIRQNKCFESDAEILQLDDRKYLFTMDEFSAEDRFRENDGYRLGWNCAAGSVSDIFACGGQPMIYAHSFTKANNWDEKHCEEFAKGVAAVLNFCKIEFIGGDFGLAEQWRYNAVVLGKPGEKIISRKGCLAGDSIYISGKIGAGNLEAALSLYNHLPLVGRLENLFPVLNKESTLVAEFSSACIDTSDGLYSCLTTLADLNNLSYNVNSIPYIKSGKVLAGLLGLPQELLFLGECGEYQLLLTVHKTNEENFLSAVKKERLTFHKIGEMTEANHPRTLISGKKTICLDQYKFRARDYSDTKIYLQEITAWLKNQ